MSSMTVLISIPVPKEQAIKIETFDFAEDENGKPSPAAIKRYRRMLRRLCGRQDVTTALVTGSNGQYTANFGK